MKYLVGFSRIFVGILFIISGLIKLNDPLGFSFKLEEYFSQGVLDLPFFMPYALAISIIVVIIEVLLGVMLLIVTDCGCFGDAIKLTPWESFTKDIILLVFILILVVGVRYIKPLFKNETGMIFMYCALLLCPKAIYEYAWQFNVNGNKEVIVTNGEYPTVDGEFVGVETTEIQKGYEPPIHDFTIEKDGGDYTEGMLQEPKLVMVIAYDLAKTNESAFTKVKQITDKALRNGYKVIGMSASSDELSNPIENNYGLNFDFYFTDETTLKTMVRSNPAVLVMENGTIQEKVHFNDIEKLKL